MRGEGAAFLTYYYTIQIWIYAIIDSVTCVRGNAKGSDDEPFQMFNLKQ